MSSSNKRGAFIVIEGLDRSGKSTQAALLRDRLSSEGHRVKLIKFPDRTTPIGKMIDSYLRSESELDDRAIHLLFSANRWELSSTITKELEEGTTLICDRYAFSGIAFSASKGLPFEWCKSPDISLPAPDLILFLDISPEAARRRGGYGEERYEKEAMQVKVREIFGRIGEEMGVRWVRVDAGGEVAGVKEEIWRIVERVLRESTGGLTRLWGS